MAKRTIEELNLMDDFLFQEVLSDKENGPTVAKLILSVIMEREIGDVMVHTQKVLTPGDPKYHGIRMDVYITEAPANSSGKRAIYDVEVQNTDTKELPKRTRFYQALIDSRQLGTGEPYKAMKKLWIIMIMPEDIFGKNRMCYTFENRCLEDPDLPLGDDAGRIFLYSKGKLGGSKELAELLHYIENSHAENIVNETTEKLHQVVEKIRQKKEVWERYMKAIEYENMIREKGLEEGREEGCERHIISLICKKLVKGKETKEIAEALEEDEAYIASICEAAQKYAPEYDVDGILETLRNVSTGNR